MPVDLKVPSVGESITEVQIGRWLKKKGDRVERDENIVEIESDKASVELPSPTAGIITEIVRREGEIVPIGEIIARISEGIEAATSKPAAEPATPTASVVAKPAAPAKPAPVSEATRPPTVAVAPPPARPQAAPAITVATAAKPTPQTGHSSGVIEAKPAKPAKTPAAVKTVEIATSYGELEEVVPMSMIRRRIAQRLVEAQQTAALLTTFNEVDMSAVMQLRNEFKDTFQQQYGIKLGFMSFFIKAVIDGLKRCPELNAEIRNGNEIVYRNYYDIGVAMGGGKGLVVPILRRAELMSFAQIEHTIIEFAKRAQENKITPDELTGGTFTISNGGVYGSLLSTPIVNPPQSGILGMHAIQDRPVARNGQVVIRPMMYIALTYDHRIVDGREAVGFLKRVKEVIEEPSRMLMEI